MQIEYSNCGKFYIRYAKYCLGNCGKSVNQANRDTNRVSEQGHEGIYLGE